ncbi:glucuronate isomerase [Albibacterium sp.]|uniref:glucuronate isomerase n=1 Tax=Albibacterium sp. TaxID=2952885 RepID=UPI002C4BD05B|nr:glucuronate isomerase [Albibacterium sp.]HUH20216.1 glucuronate isomerase [Albibacterium sp.]
MKEFLDDDFLLNNKFGSRLYHEYAKDMPIIDYHSHVPPEQIANDQKFENLTQIWLYGDHYKWRAMRANGVSEAYITGDKSDYEKFEKWAETVPNTMRNPLYHWTHLELQRYFDIHELLTPKTARKIYDECSEKLQSPEFSVRSLLKKMKVKVVGTTDNPIDDLAAHKKIKEDGFEVRVLSSFRPDNFMAIENTESLRTLISQLEGLNSGKIGSFADYLKALKARHDFFAERGCSVSDHGLSHMYAEDYTEEEVESIFQKVQNGGAINATEELKFKSALLYNFALWNHEKGWVQQFHLGPLRNNNSRLLKNIGVDAGLDSIGDFKQAVQLSRFLDKLDTSDSLTKTILYNLNPADNDVVAAMVANFNDGSVAGKMQYGAAWWFLDQKIGIINQLNTVSNLGLLSHFIGMLTDSRSFLSYPRHEYFRRILCNLLGEDVERGELPADIDFIGKMVQDICYNNAKTYFTF